MLQMSKELSPLDQAALDLIAASKAQHETELFVKAKAYVDAEERMMAEAEKGLTYQEMAYKEAELLGRVMIAKSYPEKFWSNKSVLSRNKAVVVRNSNRSKRVLQGMIETGSMLESLAEEADGIDLLHAYRFKTLTSDANLENSRTPSRLEVPRTVIKREFLVVPATGESKEVNSERFDFSQVEPGIVEPNLERVDNPDDPRFLVSIAALRLASAQLKVQK